MKLLKLEINGFKSFYHKTELSFPTGTTAVIGPNGSGKSNISDAVRWVLGEQSAKALRGTKMEDVIFNGTQLKRARSFCEVTLTFDNSDNSLRSPYSEVAVLRRCFRNGESEYAINDVACRMRDIVELFRDTGIGKEGYSIIGQGKVEEILSNKSNERRNAIDEAAGIMRFRVRKEDAERKLTATDDNLARLNDIRTELESRVGPLKEQSDKARTFLALRDELKDLEINLCLLQYDRQTAKLEALAHQSELLKTEEAEANTTEAGLLSSCAAEEDNVRRLDDAIYEQQNKLMDLLSGVESHIGDTKLLAERKENAQKQIEMLRSQTDTECEKLTRIKRMLDELSDDTADTMRTDSARDALDDAESELLAAESRCAETEASLDTKKNEMMNAMNRLAEAKSGLSRFDTMLVSLSKRLEQIASDYEREKARLLTFREELSAFTSENTSLEMNRTKLNTDLSATVSQRECVEKEYADLQIAMRGDEHEISSVQSRLSLLSEMISSHEGYFTSVKNLLTDTKKSSELSRRILGVVAELFLVPAKYETAITNALGSALQNIVVHTPEDAKYAIEYLRTNGYGRATFLPISMLRENTLSDAERELIRVPGCIGVAADLISCAPDIEKVKNHLLGRTVIVQDMDIGISLSKKSDRAFYIVTLNGDIISVSGAMTGGSTQSNTLSLLGREREQERLRNLLSEKEALMQQSLEKSEALKKQLVLLNLQTDSIKDELRNADVALSRRQEQEQLIHHDISNCEEKLSELDTEKSSIEESVAELNTEKERITAERSAIETGNTTYMADIRSLQTELIAYRKQRDAIAERVTELKIALTKAEGDMKARLKEKERLVSEQKDIETVIASHDKEIAALTEQIAAVEQQLGDMFAAVENEQGLVARIKEEQRLREEDKALHVQTLSENREALEKLRSELTLIRDRIHKTELDCGKIEAERTALLDRIWHDYELTYERASEYRHTIAASSSGTRINEIKAAMRELGDVNVNAIEEYTTVSARYDELNRQYDDLTKAREDLRSLISDLTHSMEREFSKQFPIIRANFTSVFKDLFGGGTAEICLSDEKDVLGSDIQIIAQPPGKKLQLLTLLSGGERALTAIALVFALLKIKPPAFCILDEIESSLDEANVTRFAEYVRSLSDATQFVLITHRKGSMEVCDSLYGVSMEEKGISKVVSAKFNKES